MKKKPCATHWDCFTSMFWIRDDGNVEFAAPIYTCTKHHEASLESSESEISAIFSSESRLPASEVVCILSCSASSLRKKKTKKHFYLSMLL
ncbi:hypothetical protein MTR_1g039790 [Medicago truncatula]|uniref:Uncharacterized protein n=1 Tax=Medicago truncatula TaxID=3880 RepID=A0A072VHR2_MEDTR|nr:hypothetical protein MTR_1g039790 [Medicago truncatula]